MDEAEEAIQSYIVSYQQKNTGGKSMLQMRKHFSLFIRQLGNIHMTGKRCQLAPSKPLLARLKKAVEDENEHCDFTLCSSLIENNKKVSGDFELAIAQHNRFKLGISGCTVENISDQLTLMQDVEQMLKNGNAALKAWSVQAREATAPILKSTRTAQMMKAQKFRTCWTDFLRIQQVPKSFLHYFESIGIQYEEALSDPSIKDSYVCACAEDVTMSSDPSELDKQLAVLTHWSVTAEGTTL